LRVGVDAGGTFTDVVALGGDGALRVHKLPSQPGNPAAPVAAALAQLREGDGEALTELVHSTTVATNALLERRGGPVALVTTAGFEDVIELGRQARPRLYALHPTLTPPLVEARHRLGVAERLAADASVVLAPTAAVLDELRARVQALAASDGIRAVAICTLHSYVDGKHERAIAEALAPLGLPLSLSSEVLPLMREYERASTTVVDAYVKPVMAPYLEELGRALAPARLRVMQSSGGALAADEAARHPVRTILSGPAAGVIGAQAVARTAGLDAVITLDMGGTSADVALIAGGECALTDEAELAGCALQMPMLAVHTVGAGGGSIARLDAAGALKVGPESAGAQPGPAAYDRGGLLPTVTDANVVLGRLPVGLLGGAMPLSRARAEAALLPLAQQLGVTVERAAEDVLDVAAAVMARAIKVISVERGHDPAAFTLLPFGGAGALHACQVARELDMRRILVPPSPGLLCAYGALAADVRYDFVSTRLRTVGAALEPSRPSTSPATQGSLDVAALAGEWLPLTQAAMAALDRDGVPPEARKLERWASLRYRGQSFELMVAARGDLVAAFHAAHRERYGYALPDRDVELVTLRLRAVGRVPAPPVPREPLEPGPVELARVPLVLDGVTTEAPLLARARLRPGVTLAGPALIGEYSATTLLAHGWRGEVLPSGALLLER
jgi:N-methylhydantoinase A